MQATTSIINKYRCVVVVVFGVLVHSTVIITMVIDFITAVSLENFDNIVIVTKVIDHIAAVALVTDYIFAVARRILNYVRRSTRRCT